MKIFVAPALLMMLAACQPAGETPAPASAPAGPEVAAPAPIPASTTVRYFYFGNHVPRAEILSVTGADTASATLTGRTTAQDNYDYCMGYSGPDDADAAARCASEKIEQPVETMGADCVARTVTQDGSDILWVRDEPAESGKIMPVWQDKASGQIRDYSGAGGGYVLTAAFRILCPTASADIAPDPS